MTCQAIHLWTFNGLVAAFLDLAIAYLLLCGSTLVFFTFKFLKVFGLCLPCPCDGIFGNLSSDHCYQKLLMDSSSKKISSVLYSAMEKCPFDSMWETDPNCGKSMLALDKNVKDSQVELEGEAPCSSLFRTKQQRFIRRDFPDRDEPDTVVGLTSSLEEGEFYIRKNRVGSQRRGNSLQNRCKGHKVIKDHRKVMPVTSNDVVQLKLEDIFQSPSSFRRSGDNINEDSFFSVDSEDGRETSTDISNQDKTFSDLLQLDNSLDEKICSEMDELSAGEAGVNCQGELVLDGNESDTIRLLEQALEEEQSARASLYVELEKERSAAASAADEAMAMILRLQEEKASIEMDARQYQRIIEEKAAYDAEEMSILKEIVLRREREMHFLEKEVEAYRRDIFGVDDVDSDTLELPATPQRTSYLPYSTRDPSHTLQRDYRSTGETQGTNYAKRSSEHELPFSVLPSITLEFGEELPIMTVDELDDTVNARDICMHDQGTEIRPQKLSDSEELNKDIQEKVIVPVEECSYIRGDVNGLEGYKSTPLGIDEKAIISIRDEHEKVNNDSCERFVLSKIIPPSVESKVETHGKHQNQWTRDHLSTVIKTVDSHDFYVAVDDEDSRRSETSVNGSKELERVVNGASSHPLKCRSPSFSLLQRDLNIARSSSDPPSRLPPMATSRGNRLHSELRRNSMSAVDYERSKIGSEVEWLRERLKVVREGREKLKFTMEFKEKEDNQLQLLENITNHLREIQQLTGPEKAIRQASLPPSSKAILKKRSWRSSSLSIHRSN